MVCLGVLTASEKPAKFLAGFSLFENLIIQRKEKTMVEQGRKRIIITHYCVPDDFEGLFKCERCGKEAPWKNESYETRRCDDVKCNSRMRLELSKKLIK